MLDALLSNISSFLVRNGAWLPKELTYNTMIDSWAVQVMLPAKAMILYSSLTLGIVD